MIETRYRAAPRIRRGATWGLLVGGPVACAVTALAFSFKGGFGWDKFLVLLGVCVLLITPVCAFAAGQWLGSTFVDDAGIHLRAFPRRRNLRWDQIRSLDVQSMGRGGSHALHAGLGRGRYVPLPGVMGLRKDDPEFVAMVEAIRQARRAGRTSEQAGPRGRQDLRAAGPEGRPPS